LLDLLDGPRHVEVKSDLIFKEIIYDLLISEQGGRLWQIAMTGSQSNRMHKVINWLRHHYAEPLRAEDLAEMAAMSVSAMQHRFRDLTSLSPLQFQKRLRLEEARRLMLVEDLDAGMAAMRVGYESQSQFTREYARMFGQPPMRDIKQLRALGVPTGLTPEGARMA
jgi:AraC-like DNA-binding protein